MRAVIQRVSFAEVQVGQEVVGSIQQGIFTLLGVERGDDESQVQKLIQKIVNFRVFEDENGKLNRSLLDVKGEHLIVSQFTLAADCDSGRRPSFSRAAAPEEARSLYERAISISQNLGVSTSSGLFQADMKIRLCNDGPLTFVLDVKRK